ncbi:MAG: type II secretion system protein [Patescibacteria group bacterium]
MSRKTNKQTEFGFTVIEVLASLVVIGIILSLTVTIITTSQSVNRRTAVNADASAAAFEKLQDYINTSYASIPVGSSTGSYEVEDFTSEISGLNLVNAVAKVYVEPLSIVDTTTTTVVTNYSQNVAADSTFLDGSEIVSIQERDNQGNDWRWESNFNENTTNNSQYTNYTYNRWDNNPDNLPSPSIDLGSAQTVDLLLLNWYHCNYESTDFRVEAKNSSPTVNSGWTTIESGLSKTNVPCNTNNTSDHSQSIDVSSNTTPYRYWRLYFVNSTHWRYQVISEFEAFSSGVPGDIVEQHGAGASNSPGALYFSSSDLELAEDGDRGQQSVGIIFDNLDPTQGSTIDDAYIEFTADESDDDPVTLRVTGVDADSPPAWSGTFVVDNSVDTDNSDGFVGTTATSTWTPADWSTGESGPDTRVNVTSILQEIVNRSGWSPSSSAAFVIQYVSGSDKRVAERTPAPELFIDWSESETVTNPGIYIDNDGDGDADNPTLLRVTTRIEYESYGQQRQAEYVTFIRQDGIGSN